jgi:hypothetical protein
LQAAGVPQFIGLRYPHDPPASKYPVPPARIENFKDFVRWTFGTKDERRLLPDSRALTEWGKILRSSEAVRYLRLADAPEFERAWAKSGGEAESVADSLYSAAYSLEQVVPLASSYVEDDDVQAAVRRCTLYFGQILRNFPGIAEQHQLTFLQ